MDYYGIKKANFVSSPYHIRRIRMIAGEVFDPEWYRIAFIPTRFKSNRGLLNHLLDSMPVPDLIVWPGIEKLTVISGGKTIHESSEVIASPQMRELVADMKARYPERYMLFDVPPILAGSNALAFAPLVDWIIVVVQAGKTPLPEVKRALQMLPKKKVLGLVLNRHTSKARIYPYP